VKINFEISDEKLSIIIFMTYVFLSYIINIYYVRCIFIETGDRKIATIIWLFSPISLIGNIAMSLLDLLSRVLTLGL